MSKYIPATIPINTLSGGVGRQAMSKRLPSEAQDLDNVYCTLEKSIEKRLGIEMVPNTEGSIDKVYNPSVMSSNIWYHWFTISNDLRFLIIINPAEEIHDGETDFLTVIKLDGDGNISRVDGSKITVDIDAFSYLKYAFDSDEYPNPLELKSVAIGTSLLLLNPNVKAGFTSDGEDEFLFDFSGEKTEEIDLKGPVVDYQTASAVDPKGEAVIWTGYGQYIAGDEVIVSQDPGNDDGTFMLWRVDDSITGTIGPETVYPGQSYKTDIDMGTIDDITLNPEYPNGQGYYHETSGSGSGDTAPGLEVGMTWFIEKGGSKWVDSDNNTADALAGAVHYAHGKVYAEGTTTEVGVLDGARIRCTNASDDSEVRTWEVNKWRKLNDDDDIHRSTEFISVSDNVYPDPDKPHLGQAVTNVTKLKFPPDSSDIEDRNNAEIELATLYDTIGDSAGRGKVYYFTETYSTLTPGHYRIKDVVDQPYLHKIRTPDKMSVIDKNRMPMQLDYDGDTGDWNLKTVDWDHRTGGGEESNPGPSPFRGPDDKAKQVTINTMAWYRDRLFLAAGDILFTSRLGDFDNFWIDDPSNIVSSDPIDLRLSSNKYSPIQSMIPFNDFLFINTSGDTQFELIGSENQITPFTAEIAPTTFYSTISTIEPQLLGNQIYFFDESRLYIYFGQEQTNINQAVDVSTHCPGYLPKNIEKVATSPSHSSIFFTDKDNPNHIYSYVNRFSGSEVIQNAFFRFVLDSSVSVKDIITFDNYLYMINRLGTNLYLQRLPLSITDETISNPILDNHVYSSTTGVSRSYNGEDDTTDFILPFECNSIDTAIVTSGSNAGWIYSVTAGSGPEDDTTKVSIVGNVDDAELLFGTNYTSTIHFSEQFVRDEKNNIINGVLNLRSLSLRHTNTGEYSVTVQRRKRNTDEFRFVPQFVDQYNLSFPLNSISDDGEHLVRVFGLSNEMDLKIISDTPLPLNITNIEFRGKFNRVDSVLERR